MAGILPPAPKTEGQTGATGFSTLTGVPAPPVKDIPDTSFTWFSLNNPYRSGYLPSYAPSSGTASEMRNLINAMSPDEIYNLKRRLWAAGYYAKVFGVPTKEEAAADIAAQQAFIIGNLNTVYVPQSGMWGENYPTGNKNREDMGIAGTGPIGIDDAALELAITEFRSSGKESFDQFLTTQIAATSNNRQAIIANTFGLEQLNTAVQTMASQNIGRELSDEELNSFYQRVFGGEPNRDRQGSDQILVGGNLSSSAISYGKRLGASYGLVASGLFEMDPTKYGDMNGAVSDGLVVQYRGDQNNLQKMLQWVNSNIGDDKTFSGVQEIRDSGGQLTGIRVAVREGARVPSDVYLGGIDYEGSDDEFAQFLNAARNPYGVSGYAWQTPIPGRYGAYGLEDSVWQYYANTAGLDLADKSAFNQEYVARLYANDLYARYKGDWQLAAVAFQGGKELADRIFASAPGAETGLDYLSGEYADLDAVKGAKKLIERMGQNKVGLGVAPLLGMSSSVTSMGSFDVGLEQPFRSTDPKELAARQERVFKNAYKYEIASANTFAQLGKDVQVNAVDAFIERRRKERDR